MRGNMIPLREFQPESERPALAVSARAEARRERFVWWVSEAERVPQRS
jgi:hypothetical protein